MNRTILERPRPRPRLIAPDDIVAGLTGVPRSIPSKYFYDETGAELFDRICALDEYYPTRTEVGILREHLPEIATWAGRGTRIVEFGSGSGLKTRLLLRSLDQPREYLPVDINAPQLGDNAALLRRDFPTLQVTPVPGDYAARLRLPHNLEAKRTIIFFPGSTIGNFEPAEALAFLQHARGLAGREGGLVIGVDLKKDRATLERAYNDALGVTAAFNLNVLAHVNALADADFDLSGFEHVAFYNERASRIEMHLRSSRRQTVTLGGARQGPVVLHLHRGEQILTEHSYKYGVEEFRELAAQAGFVPRDSWTDARRWFSVQVFDRREL